MNRDDRFVDLRSDTVTIPTETMREAMRTAVVGDDVYGEDPTVHRLEALAAERLGKAAALFVPSGTMGNQIALLIHARRGEEVILEEQCHIYSFEVGGPAFLAGLLTRPLRGTYGILDPVEVQETIRPESLHTPRTALVCLESPTNRGGGTIYTPTLLREISHVAHNAGVAVHLDGARIFNAAVAMGIPAAEFARPADSVMFCVSKSLAAPIGSLVVGGHEFIERARRFRKLLGGGMRQVGVIAAAGRGSRKRPAPRQRSGPDRRSRDRLEAGPDEYRDFRGPAPRCERLNANPEAPRGADTRASDFCRLHSVSHPQGRLAGGGSSSPGVDSRDQGILAHGGGRPGGGRIR
ncbi:MAG: GntG family PLP-dependent aldolase, partial [candidate division NC10 bacterium]